MADEVPFEKLDLSEETITVLKQNNLSKLSKFLQLNLQDCEYLKLKYGDVKSILNFINSTNSQQQQQQQQLVPLQFFPNNFDPLQQDFELQVSLDMLGQEDIIISNNEGNNLVKRYKSPFFGIIAVKQIQFQQHQELEQAIKSEVELASFVLLYTVSQFFIL